MTIILSFIVLILILLVVGKVFVSLKFKNEVGTLFSESGNISHKKFHYNQLQGLPEPVQRYFRLVLKEGQPYISYIRLKHDGLFKTDQKKDWVAIAGEQYFTTQTPGFIWKGTTSMFTAKDRYISSTGRLVVSLFSILKIADGRGEKYDHGELLRWLGESVWFPTNLLPNQHLQWFPIDNTTARLAFSYNNISISYIVSFNAKGEIIHFQTQRYMGDGGLTTWIGIVSNYKKINGVKVPTTIEAIYRLKEGDFSYAKFKVNKIEYDKPFKF
ncbi:DUF6544 family protein [Segetibacter aerophilus]|nr:DUF6544 family protein [Segetibacter aerophilus]